MEFILDSDTRAAADFDDRWVALIHTIIPAYSLPVAPDPESDHAAAVAAAEAVAFARGEAPATSMGGAADDDGAGPSTAAPAAEHETAALGREATQALRSYFNTLWNMRHKWAGVYVRGSLILTELTSGRSESWHNVLKTAIGYNGHTTLVNLITNNNRALDKQLAEDTGQWRAGAPLAGPGLLFSNLLVTAARAALSPFAANMVTGEASSAQLYTVLGGIQDGERLTYTVRRPETVHEGPTGTEKCRQNRIVTVTTGADRTVPVATRMECSCQMLTSVGLPCRHMIAVLTVRQEAQTLPAYLYHPHWARDGPSPVDLISALHTRPAPPPRFPQQTDAGGSRRGGRTIAVSEVIDPFTHVYLLSGHPGHKPLTPHP